MPARVVSASPTRVGVRRARRHVAGRPLPVARRRGAGERARRSTSARPLATGLHQVDNPVFDRAGQPVRDRSAARAGQQVAGVDLPRRRRRRPRAVRVGHRQRRRRWRSIPTASCTCRSRFDGTVYRVTEDGTAERSWRPTSGVACGLAFAPDGALLVGDRSGTMFRVDAAGTRRCRSPRCRRAWPRSTWRSAPTAALRRGADALASRRDLPRRSADGAVEVVSRRVRPAAGARVRRRRRAARGRGAGGRERRLPRRARPSAAS